MRQFKILATVLGASLLVAACGGSDKVQFTSQVSFGDSLSDVGTYKVGTVAALGGGKYTVNSATAKNWTEVIASQINVVAPCAAQTGLLGDATQGFSVPVVNYSACRNYAQGGARVTNPVGPGNKLLGGSNAILGQMTVPIVTQIATHLATVGGSFSGKELVTVMAGGNDALMNFATFGATVGAGGNASTAGAAAVTAMGVAGAELAGYIKTQIVAKGAQYVAVVNLPDVSKTPFAYTYDAATQGLINQMVTTFNTQLQTGLSGAAGVRIVDAYAVSRDQAANPAKYGLSNVTTPACNLSAAANPLGSSLVCSAANVIAGDVSRYQFADSVHPTPYGYQLLADAVSKEMSLAGWQ